MTKELKVAVEEPQVAVPVEPVVNDSSAGLARMYQDLNPPANRLRACATVLMLFSVLFLGSLEGLFGFLAAAGVLCCAAPGSLGTAYAARCTKILATISAALALMHVVCLSTFAVAVMPEMPQAFRHACNEARQESAMLAAEPGRGGLQPIAAEEPSPSAHFIGHLLVRAQGVMIDADDEAPASTAQPVSAFVATFSTSAARRLQEVGLLDDSTHPCARAERAFADAAPLFLMSAILIETCLFIAAFNTASAAGRLLAAAQRYGANGV